MHLYIHIPFCESRCFYCSFTSLTKKDYEESYFKALLYDLKYHFAKYNIKKIHTLFIGGGTPSVVNEHFYEKIFLFLQNFLDKNAECTIEANPNSTNLTWLKNMKEFGLNRISFGAQSFNEKKLKFLGRIHSVKDIFKSVENAKNTGFNNINLDLIYDSKMDNKKNLEFELLKLSNLTTILTHISAYNLSIESNSAFFKKENYKKNAPNLMKFFIKGIENLGFKQYEISNFGKICKHNLSYWQGRNYLACGLSGVSFLNGKRLYTHKNLNSYIKDPLFRKIEILSKKDLDLEHLFLGLRSCVGVKISRLNLQQQEKAKLLIKHKKLFEKNGLIFNKNYLLSDEIALFLSN